LYLSLNVYILLYLNTSTMAKLQFSKIIGGVGAGALVGYLEKRAGGVQSQPTALSNIIPIALASASVLGFVPRIGGMGKIIGQVGEASVALVAYKLFNGDLALTGSNGGDTRIFHRSVSPVNTFTGDMSLSGL
jgi:hypothetical protein